MDSLRANRLNGSWLPRTSCSRVSSTAAGLVAVVAAVSFAVVACLLAKNFGAGADCGRGASAQITPS